MKFRTLRLVEPISFLEARKRLYFCHYISNTQTVLNLPEKKEDFHGDHNAFLVKME
jgi:hypothetical protein